MQRLHRTRRTVNQSHSELVAWLQVLGLARTRDLGALGDVCAAARRRNLQRLSAQGAEPGHTHTYLDALYSHLQRALREHTLGSVADVVDALTHAFKDERLQPTITVLEAASDWSAFFASSLETIAGHSQPLGFRFARVESGPHAPVRMFVRDNSKGEWLGYRRTSEPIVVLKSLPRGNLKALPPLEGKDKDAQTHAVEVALSKHLIEQLEADELKRIIAEELVNLDGVEPVERH